MSSAQSTSDSDSFDNDEIIVSNLSCGDETYQDETLVERVQSLGEIFPSVIRKPFGMFGRFLSSIYRGACEASWIFFIITAITFGPVVFEAERQRQIQLPENKNSKNSPQ